MIWELFQSKWPFGERVFLTLIILVVYLVGYWLPNGLLAIVYKYNLFPKWKLYDLKQFPPQDLVKKCIIHNLINTFITQPLISWFLIYPLYKGKIFVPLPSLSTIATQILICFLFADGSFYWLHRALHHRLLYKTFHKQHHEFKATIGIAANYASVVEDVFVNILSTLIGPAVLGYCTSFHLITLCVYLALRYEESVEEHSGYDIKFSPWYLIRSNGHHAFHHTHNVGAYGTFPFWDWIMNTDRPYRDYIARRKNTKQHVDANADLKTNSAVTDTVIENSKKSA